MKQIWWVIGLLLLQTAFAASIDSAFTTAVMDEETVEITSKYIIESEGIEDIILKLPGDVNEIKALFDRSTRECKIEYTRAHCGTTTSGVHEFEAKYTTTEPIAKLDERTVFKLTSELPFTAQEHTVILKLPVRSVIPQEKEKDPEFFITPKTEKITSDGQRIVIEWKNENRRSISVSAVTEPISKEKNNSIVWIIIAGIAVAIAIGAVAYASQSQRKVSKKNEKNLQKKKQKPLLPQFIEHEQKVVSLLTKSPEMWQKDILKETGFSKAKLSRIIRNLEARGVVTKTIYGNTNKVSLKKP